MRAEPEKDQKEIDQFQKDLGIDFKRPRPRDLKRLQAIINQISPAIINGINTQGKQL